jgi:hypothetical protein
MIHSLVIFLHTWPGQVILETLGVAFAFSAAMALLKRRCGQKHISLVFLGVSFALLGIFLFIGVTVLLDASAHSQAGLVTTLSSLV